MRKGITDGSISRDKVISFFINNYSGAKLIPDIRCDHSTVYELVKEVKQLASEMVYPIKKHPGLRNALSYQDFLDPKVYFAITISR